MSAPGHQVCAISNDHSVPIELESLRNREADQSTSVGEFTLGSDDAPEQLGVTHNTLVEENRPLLAHVEHVDSEQVSAVAMKH
jgi:hypothetical protein